MITIRIEDLQKLREQIKPGLDGNYHPESNLELRALVFDETVKLSEIDVSYMRDFSDLFSPVLGTVDGRLGLVNPPRDDLTGIENWQMSNAENLSCMFMQVEVEIPDLSKWDVSQVKNCAYMFASSSIHQDLTGWDLNKCENISAMFDYSAMSHDDYLKPKVAQNGNFAVIECGELCVLGNVPSIQVPKPHLENELNRMVKFYRKNIDKFLIGEYEMRVYPDLEHKDAYDEYKIIADKKNRVHLSSDPMLVLEKKKVTHPEIGTIYASFLDYLNDRPHTLSIDPKSLKFTGGRS